MDESLPYLIAIDGGGTRCRFAMAGPTGRHDLVLGSANVYSDRAAAISTLNAGLRALAERAAMPEAALTGIPIYAGLAGVTDADTGAEIARHLPSRIVQVEDDRRSAVVGALGPVDGCLIGIGTGSFLARQSDGEIRLIGGYGALIGDDASGYWLGQQLLRRVLLAADGIAPDSALTRSVRRRFDEDPMQIVRFAGQARPAEIADFAPEIIAAAQKGDVVAVALMREGADYVAAGLQALGRDDPEPVCAVGGVASHYIPYLSVEVQSAMIEPAGTALDGALQLAAQLAERARLGAA
ncbi:BadF/BadG/BcrA/BcrD ATPase family protein [Ruegeria arenilitoris]|uniref:BadF/BadG/BcrA/BcrD ATPase family protein n=1 Tax=Ruegeria arenilitoris TaxID=1173585 RepID=UPI00147BA339|nr:BadF/BadG/BcrA/BcrD ATPase family protein [Ruegeria arenilitoris]